jgi:GTPase SAR1 family protein
LSKTGVGGGGADISILSKYPNALISLFRDTSGQDKYVQLCENFFRCANGAVFVYDVNNRASFHNLKKWMRKVKENAKGIYLPFQILRRWKV